MSDVRFIRVRGRVIPVKNNYDSKRKVSSVAQGALLGASVKAIESAFIYGAKNGYGKQFRSGGLFRVNTALGLGIASLGAAAAGTYYGYKADKKSIKDGNRLKTYKDAVINLGLTAGSGLAAYHGLGFAGNGAAKLSELIRKSRAKIINPEAMKTTSTVLKKSAFVKSSKTNFKNLLGFKS